ncbi:MAG: Mov34/MPN/PAD-1 family protein [bacterium]|nr:Mov34/MPN/PAD-1 family protein [bacterium]
MSIVYNEIILSESAFFHMVTSAMEVYRKEVIGILISTSSAEGNICHVKYAIPQQEAVRKFTWAIITNTEQKLKDTIENMNDALSTKNKIVGYFHSHTDFADVRAIPEPSKLDLKSFSEPNIHIIIAINHASKTYQWLENTDGTLSGTVGKYHIKLQGYLFSNKKSRHLPIKLS